MIERTRSSGPITGWRGWRMAELTRPIGSSPTTRKRAGTTTRRWRRRRRRHPPSPSRTEWNPRRRPSTRWGRSRRRTRNRNRRRRRRKSSTTTTPRGASGKLESRAPPLRTTRPPGPEWHKSSRKIGTTTMGSRRNSTTANSNSSPPPRPPLDWNSPRSDPPSKSPDMPWTIPTLIYPISPTIKRYSSTTCCNPYRNWRATISRRSSRNSRRRWTRRPVWTA
mmetsp:Transcript_21661/g.63636  ORF Transcript_21661/g.63636 Transcript_21661/m.63636 type:complete len:222 (-) Transcript_21661:89-754(-)